MDPSTKRASKKHAFFEKGWTAPSVEDLFNNAELYAEKIPEHDRWNMFFTVFNCIGERPRDFKHQDILPFDIDGINVDKTEETVDCVVRTLGLERKKTGILFSGNGLQFFVRLNEPIEDEKYFQLKRAYYKILCQSLNAALTQEGLPGSADPSVFSPSRLMRLPYTLNRKPQRPERQAYLINREIEPFGFTLEKASGVPEVESTDQISPKALLRYPKPDTPTVLEQCDFLQHCKKNQTEISEPQWYAMMSVVGRLEGGKDLVHAYSEKHPLYSPAETDRKLQQALDTAGPRVCKNIENIWDGCQGCKHYNTELKSPILIQGENFIRTKSTGFYEVVEKDGVPRRTKPNYNDLLKHFEQIHPFYVAEGTGLIYTYNGKFWEEVGDIYIKSFAEIWFSPKPTESMRNEFCAKIRANKQRKKEWYENSIFRRINLQNGVFDIETNRLLPHSEEFAFTGILPYSYNANAKAPRFRKFMQEVTCGDEELEKVLLEFAGYCISGDSCWLHKALILSGSGSNGKSTFMTILKSVAGESLYSSLSLTALNDAAKRYLLLNKLFNLGEETHVSALAKSEVFKILVGGGEVDIKRLYQQPFIYKNIAKMMFACNKLPYSNDSTEGLYRRLVIVPFNAKFVEGKNEDKGIEQKILEELPGILNIFIENYLKLKDRKMLANSRAIADELASFKDSNDTMGSWFYNTVSTIDDIEAFVATDELWTSFENFCDFRSIKSFYTYTDFCKFLANQLVDKQARKSISGKKLRGYKGISLEQPF